MIQEPAFLSDAREGGCAGKQRRQVDGTQTAQDNHYDEGDLPPANAEWPTGFPLRNPARFLLQLLQQIGPIGMPRMDGVQMADEVLRLHRDIADWTAVHLRHDDLDCDRMREDALVFRNAADAGWVRDTEHRETWDRVCQRVPTTRQYLFVA